MKWIGQQIWDLASRFRDDVYFEDLAETTETRGLVVDADGKLSINPISGDEHATHVYDNVRNDEGSTIPVGTPVYSKGEVGGSERILVGIAKANDPTKMPAIGITNTELTTTGSTKDGLITLVGVYNTNISGFSGLSINNVVYVASGGGLTITKPTGVNLIQNVGIILKTNGSIIQGLQVTCVGRTNDVPTPLHVDHANQRLGIGTTSPSQKLEVNGNIALTGNEQWIGNSANNSANKIKFFGSSDTMDLITGDSSAYNGWDFLSGTTSRVRITRLGNVGIGTSSPSAKLDIVSASATGIEVNTTGGYFAATFTTDYDNVARFLSSDSDSSIVIQDSNSTNNGNKIGVITDDMYFKTNAAEKMRITSAGNVGIGTSSPQKTLDVAGGDIRLDNSKGIYFSTVDANIGRVSITGDESNDFIRLKVDNNNSHVINLNTTGVGVGTTSPASKLHVAGTVQVGVDDTGHDVKFYGATSGRYLLWDESEDTLKLQDTTQLKFGDGSDMSVYHTSGQNWIDAYSGQLNIRQLDNDADITFQSDDGSGGTATYLTLDGSTTRITSHVDFDFTDHAIFANNTELRWKDSGGTERTILELTNANDLYLGGSFSGSMIFVGGGAYTERMRIDDSGGVLLSSTLTVGVDDTGHDVKFFGATSGAYMLWDESRDSLTFTDSSMVQFGTGGDLDMYHNGTVSRILNATGNLEIINNADDGDIIFKSDNGAGSNATYFSLDGSLAAHDGSATTGLFTKWGDNSKIVVGNGADGRFYHNATNTYLENTNGDLYIQNKADDKDIIFQSDDGSGGIETYFFLDGSANTSGSPKTIFPDNSHLALGNSGDFFMYHDGTNTILDNLTGNITIQNKSDDKDIIFKSDDGVGGVATYFYLDGSAATHDGSATTGLYTNWPDKSRISMGNSNDLQIYHDGTNSNIINAVGNLAIQNNANDGDIKFFSDDGSGGVATYLTLDGGLGRTTVQKNMQFADNAELWLGDGPDFKMFHDGSNTHLQQIGTGNLYIQNTTDDKDIIFQSDDGSGSTTEYFRLDGGVTEIIVSKKMQFGDDVKAVFGAGEDLDIFHDGTNSTINNAVGNLILSNDADDGDIIFKSDNGSGGLAAYLTLDGSAGHTTVQKEMNFGDNVEATFGASNDLKVYHSGSHSYMIQRGTGNLYIQQTTNDADITFTCDDGSGGNTAYLTLDGSAGFTRSNKEFRMDDNVKFQAGTGGDLDIYHSGSHAVIDNATGNFTIQNSTDDGDIIFKSDDGSGGVTAYLTLDGGDGHTTANKEIQFVDGVVARFGSGNDMAIRHTGSHSYISHDGTGNLYIDNTADDAETIFRCDDGSGGTTAYLTLDGRNEEVVFSKPIVTAETQIKILPHQFMSNEDGGVNKSAQFRDDTIIGVRSTADDSELYAFVEIPYGKTATNVTVYGNDASLAVNVYESDINAGALTDKTPGAGCVVGDVCDITDVAYSATNYLVIKVTTVSYTNDIVYGAVVTIT